MEYIKKNISLDKLKAVAENTFGVMVKAVVDIEKETMVVDGELHADQEKMLIELGSDQKNLWGINIYPFESGSRFIEFDSMINLRPWMNNRSRGIDSKEIQDRIVQVVHKLVSL